jgi:hypothetical protein
VALGLNYSGVAVTGVVVAMGFAMLALVFTRTEKPSSISIEELDYLYGVNTTQLLDGNSTFYRGFHEIRSQLLDGNSTFYRGFHEIRSQLLDGNSTFYRGFHEIRCSLGNSVSNFSSSIQEGSDELISQFLGRCK